MDRGHIKLWRKSFDSGIIQNANLWTFWTWCLLKASWKKRNVIINFQHVEIEPGQFIFGRKVASYELKMSEQVIRTCLKSLQKMKNVTIKSTNKYSIISIVNWDSYQGLQPTTNQQVNQQLTSNQPASNQQLTTDKKERKKEVIESKEPKEVKIHVFENHLKEKITEQNLSQYELKIIEFYNYRMSMKKKDQYQTEKGINGLIRNVLELKTAGLNVNDSLEKAMEKNWKAPEAKYFENKNSSNGKPQNNFDALVDESFNEMRNKHGY